MNTYAEVHTGFVFEGKELRFVFEGKELRFVFEGKELKVCKGEGRAGNQ